MKLTTNKLLLISAVIIGLTMLASSFWEVIGFGVDQAYLLAFAMMIAFGLNIAGVISGFKERGQDKKKSIFGIIGNMVLILVFLYFSTYALMTMN
jgi:hypothetical protein